ncbi:MAG: DUF92 domain-containing protein [Oscillospiraceae bacterium]|nr:DUF92 domain-containing protein [Oscillospiraceae bacterium]
MAALVYSLILSTLLAAFALWRRALTVPAGVLAWCFSVIITFVGGLGCFAALAATFVFTVIAGKISGARRESMEVKLHKKTGRRDAVQIICNVGVGTLMLALYALTHRGTFFLAYAAVMAASLADSMASELGVLSRRRPVDIFTFKPAQPGLSGAVSPFGTLCSLIGAALIAAVFALTTGCGMTAAALITVLGFVGALVDSALGSALQAKYRCPVCSALTEKPVHCGQAGRREKGLGWVNNDCVNLLNNLITAALAIIVF